MFGKQWLDSGCILMLKPISFANGLGIQYKRSIGIDNDTKIFNMSNLKFGIAIFFFFFLIFIYFWLCWVLVAARGISVLACGLLSSCGVQAPECVGSVAAARGLSCPVACGILVPRPGIEPMSSALESRFLTTGPPRKSLELLFSEVEKMEQS